MVVMETTRCPRCNNEAVVAPERGRDCTRYECGSCGHTWWRMDRLNPNKIENPACDLCIDTGYRPTNQPGPTEFEHCSCANGRRLEREHPTPLIPSEVSCDPAVQRAVRLINAGDKRGVDGILADEARQAANIDATVEKAIAAHAPGPATPACQEDADDAAQERAATSRTLHGKTTAQMRARLAELRAEREVEAHANAQDRSDEPPAECPVCFGMADAREAGTICEECGE